ncbi:MAG: two pore domain potassium channel family protein [Planctomycetes bacterium]|nr:two pore domain potassium channel family protein [Planctomycetota bacterium]
MEARLTEQTDTPPLRDDVVADFAPELAPGGKPDEHLRDSVEAQALYDRAVREATTDERDAVVHFLRAAKLADAAREWYLAALALRAAGDIFRSPAPPYDLERALRMYLRAAAAFEACGHFDDARDLSYLVMKLRMWRGAELGVSVPKRAELFLFWAVAGFGLRPLRVLGTAAATIIGFALLFWATDGVRASSGTLANDPTDVLYFSGVTFSTVGYGDLIPAPHMRLAAMAEAVLGAFTIGLFVVVLANRLRR